MRPYNILKEKKNYIWIQLINILQITIVQMTIYGFTFLYMYTGVSKLLNIYRFKQGLEQIPYIGQYSSLIGWIIPILEILLAFGLISAPNRKISLYASVLLMGLFTIYLALMLAFVPAKMCHCGGVIESMRWETHLIFNLIYLGLGVYSILLYNKLLNN